MMLRIVNALVLYFFFLGSFSTSGVWGAETEKAEKVKYLVNKVISSYGGREAIEHVKSIFMVGRITAWMPLDTGAYTIYFKIPRKLRVHIAYRDHTEERILNDHRGYEGTDTNPLPEVTGFRYLAIAYQYKAQDIPYGLVRNAYRLSYEGKGSVNGIAVEIMGLDDEEGPPMKIYINEENSRIVKISGFFSIEGSKMNLSSEFADFKKVGEIEFPFKLTNYAGGQKVAETLVQEYKVNMSFDNAIFDPQFHLAR